MRKKKWAAYIAGDENIFFPALVSMVSLEEKNPGVFDRFIIFDGKKKTEKMSRILNKYDITHIDVKEIRYGELATSLPPMREGMWPSEVFMNWTLPEYFGDLGYAYSLKLDYDTLSLGKIQVDKFEGEDFSLSALETKSSTDIPNRPLFWRKTALA